MPFIPSFPHSLFLTGSSPNPCLGLKLGQSEGGVKEFQAESGMNRCSKAAAGKKVPTGIKKCSETQMYFACSFTYSANIYCIVVGDSWRLTLLGSIDEDRKNSSTNV